MKILVTGGAGYIGSHTAIELLAAGYDVVLLDNFSNSTPAAVSAIRTVANREVPLVTCDIADGDRLDSLFEAGGFDAVVHFAALKAVGESVADPLRYYRNNVAGTACLLDRMAAHRVKTLVFSSSATVYGEPASNPITEDFPTAPTNPYGRSKLMVEDLLRDLYDADPTWRISILRYFNPIGAHASGVLGEDPVGTPTNLHPYLAQVALGQRDYLPVFGDDYPTADGTGERDYLHVVDLAQGHVKALAYLAAQPRLRVHNLGTGQAHSVFDVLRAFESVCGRAIPHRVVARRPGDVATCFADPKRANDELGWVASRDLLACCRDMWRWLESHPNGYRS